MKRCMYCGNENDDTSLNCSKCGNRLLDIPTRPGQASENEKDDAGRSAKSAAQELAEHADAVPEELAEHTDAVPGEAAEQAEKAAGNAEAAESAAQTDMPEADTVRTAEGSAAPEAGEDIPEFLKNQNQTTQEDNAGYGGQQPYEDNAGYGGQQPYEENAGYGSQQPYEENAGYGSQQPYEGNVSYGGQQPQEQQPYAARPDVSYENGYPYGYEQNYGAQPEVQQQYGGQAYGYQNQAQQYGYAAQNQAQGMHDYGRPQQQAGGSARALMQRARKRVKSPLFFLVVLLHTIMTVASILNLVTGNVLYNLNVMQDSIQKAVGSNLAVTYMNTMIDMIESANTMTILGVDVALCLPGVLVCLGLWLMFLKTRVSNEEISTAGYTLTRVMTLLQFIAVCVVLAAGLIFSVAFVVMAGASGNTGTIIAGIIMLVALILISSLTILFFVQLLHALKVMKWNVKNGTDKGRISTYVPIVGILLAIGTGLSMLPMAPNDYIGLAGQASSAAWILFGSIWLLVYRAKVRR